jgi:hypothetical protein
MERKKCQDQKRAREGIQVRTIPETGTFSTPCKCAQPASSNAGAIQTIINRKNELQTLINQAVDEESSSLMLLSIAFSDSSAVL